MIIDHPILKKLERRMKSAADIVNTSLKNKRPILLRHNADCDGYGGAIAIERSILPRISSDRYYIYHRLPQKAPFYDYGDVLRDIQNLRQDKERFGAKSPLVIVIDNGSTKQDLSSLRLLKAYGCDIIVIDHHYPGEVKNETVAVDEVVTVHINPYLLGGDNSLTAGMLATECALHIDPSTKNILFIPALTGISDKMGGDARTAYLKIAAAQGYTEEYLTDLAECIDYQTVMLHSMEARHIVDDLFGGNPSLQKEWIKVISPMVKELRKKQRATIKEFIVIDTTPRCRIATLNANAISSWAPYPSAGKSGGIAIDWLKETESSPVTVLTHGGSFLTIRSSDPFFDVNTLTLFLADKLPFAQVEGGGHACAGSIKFVEGAEQKVLEYSKEFIRNLGIIANRINI